MSSGSSRREVSSAAALKSVFGAASLPEGVLFDLERDGEGRYISVQVK